MALLLTASAISPLIFSAKTLQYSVDLIFDAGAGLGVEITLSSGMGALFEKDMLSGRDKLSGREMQPVNSVVEPTIKIAFLAFKRFLIMIIYNFLY
jgi:hypothetical protein